MDFDCLDVEASQTGFAGLVGTSQQAISARVRDGELPRGGTYAEWLVIYIERLRTEAAGRGGGDEAELRRARTEDTQAAAALKRLQFAEKSQFLIVKGEAYALLAKWAQFAGREYAAAVDRMIADIEGQLEVSVPSEIREKHATTATERIRDFGRKFGAVGGGGGGSVSASGAGSDS